MKIYISRRAARIVAIGTAVMLVSAMLTQLVLAGTPGSPTSSPSGGSPAQQGVGKQQAQVEASRPASPTAAYILHGDVVNSGSSYTSFDSTDTSQGVNGAWQFYASGAGETALRASCYGGSRTCKGTYSIGEAYGISSQSNNTTSGNTSIGVYGHSRGPGGQGVAGQNDQTGGYGGVFTATGPSGIGMKATSSRGAAVFGVSGINGANSGGVSVIGDAWVGSTTIGVRGYGSKGDGMLGSTYGNAGGTRRDVGCQWRELHGQWRGARS